MNRVTLIALCAASTWATTATAQSTVTVSGIVDAAARHVANQGVGSINALVSGSNSTSRLVFSGREDLGDGLAAGFHLEHGFLVDSGTAASADKFWDRRSTVSLSSPRLGELRLGRDFVPSYVAWSRYDPFSYVGVARSANLVSATPTGPIRSAFGTSANTTVRSDNGAQWLAPAGLAGFEGGLLVAPGEGRDAAAGRAAVRGARAGYAAKGFSVSTAITRSENSLTAAGSFQDRVLGGHLDVADVRLSAAWREFRQNESKQRLLLLGAVVTLGLHELKAAWVQADLAGRVGTTTLNGTQADQWGLGYVYNLSKRTAMYASIARIDNEGAARYVISDGPAGMAAGGTSRAHEAGVRHRF
jgi:predicted porin